MFRGMTQQKTNQWYQAISKAIYASEGSGKNLSYLIKYPRFWRVPFLINRKTTSDRQSSGGLSNQEIFCYLGAKKILRLCKEQSPEMSMVNYKLFRPRSSNFAQSDGLAVNI